MSSLFSSPKAPVFPTTATAPEPPPPAPLPDPDDVLARERKRRAAAAGLQTGRLSTILSDAGGNSQTLGG